MLVWSRTRNYEWAQQNVHKRALRRLVEFQLKKNVFETILLVSDHDGVSMFKYWTTNCKHTRDILQSLHLLLLNCCACISQIFSLFTNNLFSSWQNNKEDEFSYTMNEEIEAVHNTTEPLSLETHHLKRNFFSSFDHIFYDLLTKKNWKFNRIVTQTPPHSLLLLLLLLYYNYQL